MKSLFFCLCLFVSLSEATGQSLKDTLMLKEVFVTGRRQLTEKAFYFRNIDSLVLKKALQADLSDLLLKNSPVYIKSYGSGGLSTASFRGTSASHTQVLWNGINVNSPLWGQTDLSQLPVFFTDEISLFYGTSSLAKTSGGIGGCITLNNFPAWNQGTTFSVGQTAGSFGHWQTHLKAGFSGNKFMSRTRLLLDKAKNNFLFYDNAGGTFDYLRQKNAAYSKEGFLQEFYYKLRKNQFAGIKVMGLWNDRDLPAIMSFSGAGRYENQRDHHLNVLGEWKYYGKSGSWTFNSGISSGKMDYLLSNTNPGGTFVNYDTESWSNVFSNRLNFQYGFSDRTILKSSAEAVFAQAEYSDRKENTGFDVRRNEISVQSSLHHSFSPLIAAYALIQQKILDGTAMPFMAGAGLEYSLTADREVTFRANAGKNIHIPNLDDLYFSPGGNRNLKPEEGYQADGGVQWNRGWNDFRILVEVTGFTSWISNWILWHPSEYRYWIADNVQKVFSRGVEMNGSINWETGWFTCDLKGNYSFTRTTNEDKESPSSGMQLIYIPKHIGNVNLMLKKDTYAAVISWHYTGQRSTSTTEDDWHRMPSYYLLDLGLDKRFRIRNSSMDMNFSLNNILNKQYQVIEQRAMPGRNFSVSLVLNI